MSFTRCTYCTCTCIHSLTNTVAVFRDSNIHRTTFCNGDGFLSCREKHPGTDFVRILRGCLKFSNQARWSETTHINFNTATFQTPSDRESATDSQKWSDPVADTVGSHFSIPRFRTLGIRWPNAVGCSDQPNVRRHEFCWGEYILRPSQYQVILSYIYQLRWSNMVHDVLSIRCDELRTDLLNMLLITRSNSLPHWHPWAAADTKYSEPHKYRRTKRRWLLSP